MGLGIKAEITSPTFAYEKIYTCPERSRGAGPKLTLYHFDLYREEVLDPDIRLLLGEAFSDQKGVVAIEWAERAKNFWPQHYRLLEIEWKGENDREITVTEK